MDKTIQFAVFVLAAAVLLSGCTGQPTMYGNAMTDPTQNTVANTTENLVTNPAVNQVTNQAENPAANTTVNQTNVTTAVENTIVSDDSGACQQHSVYFIHADWCPHCQKMKPWVLDLQSQNYNFVIVTSDNLASYKDCLIGVAKMQYIPEFVCLSNKQSHVGEFTDESALKAFADACGTSG